MHRYDSTEVMTTTYETTVASFLTLAFLFAVVLHRAVRQNGRVFVDELFLNHPAAGQALIRLLDIGYVLFNVGYVAVAAAAFGPRETDAMDGVRGVAVAIGLQLVLLSVAHGVNIWLFSRKVGRAMRTNERQLEELLRS